MRSSQTTQQYTDSITILITRIRFRNSLFLYPRNLRRYWRNIRSSFGLVDTITIRWPIQKNTVLQNVSSISHIIRATFLQKRGDVLNFVLCLFPLKTWKRLWPFRKKTGSVHIPSCSIYHHVHLLSAKLHSLQNTDVFATLLQRHLTSYEVVTTSFDVSVLQGSACSLQNTDVVTTLFWRHLYHIWRQNNVVTTSVF